MKLKAVNYNTSHDNADDIIKSTLNGNENLPSFVINKDGNNNNKCIKCDKPYEDGEEYCGNCGTKLSSVDLCPKCKCGYDIDDDFCSNCGYVLRKKDYYITSENKVVLNMKDEQEYSKIVNKAKVKGIIGVTILLIVAILICTPLGKTIFGYFDSNILSGKEFLFGRFTSYVFLFGILGMILTGLAISDLTHPPYQEIRIDKEEYEKNKEKYSTDSMLSQSDKSNDGSMKNFGIIAVVLVIIFIIMIVVTTVKTGTELGGSCKECYSSTSGTCD